MKKLWADHEEEEEIKMKVLACTARDIGIVPKQGSTGIK